MDINEKWIKLGKFPTDKVFELGELVSYSNTNFTCVKIEEKDNQDGTKDIVYVMKFTPINDSQELSTPITEGSV